MKALPIFILMFLGLQFATAQKNGSLSYKISKTIFETGKKAHNNSYEYSLKFASFMGFWYETTFVVKEGEVVERRFQSKHDNGSPEYNKSWVETKEELGSHGQEGHEIMTMDKVYEDAAHKSEHSKEDYIQHFFETKNDGIISLAGSKLRNCMDDCFKGYRVSSFKWL